MSDADKRDIQSAQPRTKAPKAKKRRRRTKLPRVEMPSPFRFLDEPIVVNDNGTAGELPLAEALLLKDYERAIAGNARALKRLIPKLIEREMARPKPRRRRVKAGRILIEHGDPQNARAAMELLGIIQNDPVECEKETPIEFFCLIEPWAVEASLDRHRFGARKKDDIDFLKAWTRDPESIVWPEPAEE
jgi:hypothetical protein